MFFALLPSPSFVETAIITGALFLNVAFVAIASFTQQNHELGYAFKFLRIIILLLTAWLGIWGFIAGLLLLPVLLLTNQTLDGRYGYLYPLLPWNGKAFARLMEHEFVEQTNDTIVLELKSVSQLEKVHFKQLQTYLRLANKPFGYLINFNTDKFTIGNSIHRVTNHDYSSSSEE